MNPIREPVTLLKTGVSYFVNKFKMPMAEKLQGTRNTPNTANASRRGSIGGRPGSAKSNASGNRSRRNSTETQETSLSGSDRARPISANDSIDTATREGNLSPAVIDLDDFKQNFKQGSLELLFESAGKNKDKFKQRFEQCSNPIVITRLKRIAAVYYMAVQAGPSSESMKTINDTMAQLTDMMVADKLDRKSIFGTHQPSREKQYFKVKKLENQLVEVLSSIVGEGVQATGRALFTQGAKPFIKAYVEQKLGITLTLEQSQNISDLLDSRAKASWDYVLKGIEDYQSDKIDNVCSVIDMVLVVPHLLRETDLDRIIQPPSSQADALEDRPDPGPLAAAMDDEDSHTTHPRPERDTAGGPPNAGNTNTYNNYVYSPNNSTQFTYSPTFINITNGDKATGGTSPRTERANAAANTDAQGQYSGRADAATMTDIFSRLAAIKVLQTPRPAAMHIMPPVVSESLVSMMPVGPPAQKATTSTQPDNVSLNRAKSVTTVSELAAPLGHAQEQDLPLSGSHRATVNEKANVKHMPQITSSRITRAQVQNVRGTDSNKAADNDHNAVIPTMVPASPRRTVASQPVELSAQGLLRPNHTRGNPGVTHFAPLNQAHEDLAAARNRLKTNGAGNLSSRLDDFKPQSDGGHRTVVNEKANVKHMPQITGSRITRAQVQNVRGTDSNKAADNDHNAVIPTTVPASRRRTVASQRVELSAQGLRRPNHAPGKSIAKHFVPMNTQPEVLPTLANGKTDYTSKRLAAFKPRANGIEEDGNS